MKSICQSKKSNGNKKKICETKYLLKNVFYSFVLIKPLIIAFFVFFLFFCNIRCQLIHYSACWMGAHQETDSAFSAFLFSLYTAHCQKSTPEDTPIRNFADSALTDWTNKWRWRLPRPTASEFVDRCGEHYLQLNCGMSDFSRTASKSITDEIKIKGETIERVKVYKYLGIALDHWQTVSVGNAT